MCVSILAAGAGWESTALEQLDATPGLVVLKRCVDVDDLMASVTTGQWEVAVVAAEAPGLDGAVVRHLSAHGAGAVVILAAGSQDALRDRALASGAEAVVAETDMAELPALVRMVADRRARADDAGTGVPGVLPGWDPATGRVDPLESVAQVAGFRGRTLAVWGPVGAPGRTTLAITLAGVLADRGRAVVVVDADPHACVAQHLGVLDQVSGVLAAARLATAGTLRGRAHTVCRALSSRLGVLTGLPRPDRADEVVPGALAQVLDEVATFADVVVDLGAGLEADGPGDPLLPSVQGWNREVLGSVDEVVVVGAADPVGITRLAHSLSQLREWGDAPPVTVVINRTRPSLGWTEAEMADVVTGFVPLHAIRFLPEDRAALDKAVVVGRGPSEWDSRYTVGVRALTDVVHPETVQVGTKGAPRRSAGRGEVRRRRAGTARQR
ncbi:AAA family ATPase [Nocardioides yefusunii]|uniref:CpaE family protein n=1 Tax=Nocardioides yefusunii TaxID=2500546 RepID=A0ABW1QVE1_9ACTN|nr:hypothetical protein [Nocardioides yefusunii]